MKRYACKKDRSFGLMLLVCGMLIWSLIAISFLTGSRDTGALIVQIMIALSVTGLFLWLWKSTYYSLDYENLTARTGPFRWIIPLQDIKYIRLGQKTIGGTWKPTLSWNCMEIRSGRSRSVFITPLDQEGFLSDLISLNHAILVKEK